MDGCCVSLRRQANVYRKQFGHNFGEFANNTLTSFISNNDVYVRNKSLTSELIIPILLSHRHQRFNYQSESGPNAPHSNIHLLVAVRLCFIKLDPRQRINSFSKLYGSKMVPLVDPSSELVWCICVVENDSFLRVLPGTGTYLLEMRLPSDGVEMSARSMSRALLRKGKMIVRIKV